MKRTKKPNGVVLYKGPSVLDGQPIILVATFKTSNEKTGSMIQTWIIREDMNPLDASKSGDDESVCGACPHRHYLGGACYVTIFMAPSNIHKSYKKGLYPDYDAEIHAKYFKDESLRCGAYGDPASVPYDAWQVVIPLVKNTTGYTHQFSHKKFDDRILDFCMISAETPKQAKKYHDMGLRTFRVKTADSKPLENEIECLSDSKGISCKRCGLCDSAKSDNVNVYINVHGKMATRYEKKYGNVNIIAIG
jgi:hypothetical protein